MFHTLHYVEHIIRQFLGLAYQVHEEDTLLVAIFLIVDIEYIAVTQRVA